MTPAALEGVRVVDFTELLPGPFLTQCLVELGAEVVKVERPPVGDPVRQGSPGLFAAVNRGKASLAIDLKSAEGRARALELVGGADVLVEGFRPGVMARLGLGYLALSEINPRLIYLSLSGYGQTGPLAQVPGHDLNYLASAGITALCGEVGAGPQHSFGLPVADLCGAVYGLSAVLAALYQRERTGTGQHLDLALTDCAAHWLNARRGPFHQEGASDLDAQRRLALERPAYGVFACRDGAVTLAALEPHFWRTLVRTLGLDAFAGEIYASIPRRRAAAREINAAIAAKLAPLTRDKAVALLLAADIPAAPVLSPAEAAVSEHHRARGLSRATEAGPLAPFPVRMAGMPDMPAIAPALGEPGSAQ
jgi:crotonobetainyl-CoA:carnitine CoA-transferase CaiB-like acyl-CoA transferase